jgi:ATP-dependent exoDNAse (exonuclease V) alpha subunit
MLNTEQQQIVDAIKFSDKRIFMLKGKAGTGKSFTLKTIMDEYEGSILLTATTNKAKSLLIEHTGHKALTTHSALGFRMIRNGVEEYLNDISPASEADLLIVDEYSMLPNQVYQKALKSSYKKILFVGDEAQLPAIGIKANIIPEYEVILTKQMRQEGMNELEAFLDCLRNAINSKRFIDISEVILPEQIARYNSHKDFCNAYLSTQSNKRILAYSNRVIDSYNLNINQGNRFSIGDLLVIDKPLGNIKNGDIVEVKKVDESNDYFDLEVINENTHQIRVFKTKKAEEEWLKDSLSSGDISYYWSKKDYIYHPKHIYASTIHKAQGQSIDEVFIDVEDILAQTKRKPTRFNNYNKPISIQDYMKLLYVAISRMKIKAHLYIGKKRDYKVLKKG